jgi:NADH-ubiquinone oxidoreductase chain 6
MNLSYGDPQMIEIFIICLSFITALFVILSQNPIISVFNLIILYILVAMYLMYLGITYVGISYIIIYIGAIAILFLFIIMMIDIEITYKKYGNYVPLLGFSFISLIFSLLFSLRITYETNIISYSFNWDSSIMKLTQISTIGDYLYSNFFAFIYILSIILLLAMIGAIILTNSLTNSFKANTDLLYIKRYSFTFLLVHSDNYYFLLGLFLVFIIFLYILRPLIFIYSGRIKNYLYYIFNNKNIALSMLPLQGSPDNNRSPSPSPVPEPEIKENNNEKLSLNYILNNNNSDSRIGSNNIENTTNNNIPNNTQAEKRSRSPESEEESEPTKRLRLDEEEYGLKRNQHSVYTQTEPQPEAQPQQSIRQNQSQQNIAQNEDNNNDTPASPIDIVWQRPSKSNIVQYVIDDLSNRFFPSNNATWEYQKQLDAEKAKEKNTNIIDEKNVNSKSVEHNNNIIEYDQNSTENIINTSDNGEMIMISNYYEIIINKINNILANFDSQSIRDFDYSGIPELILNKMSNISLFYQFFLGMLCGLLIIYYITILILKSILLYNSIKNFFRYNICILNIRIWIAKCKCNSQNSGGNRKSMYLLPLTFPLDMPWPNFEVYFYTIIIIAILLWGINILFSIRNLDMDKGRGFECGLQSFFQTREQFHISFHRVSLLFLAFDLEIIIIYPASVSDIHKVPTLFFNLLAFLIILMIGFIYEISVNALDIYVPSLVNYWNK